VRIIGWILELTGIPPPGSNNPQVFIDTGITAASIDAHITATIDASNAA
jgi:hypothetical protein